jgi:DNA primase
MRLAIAMLIQHPELAREIGSGPGGLLDQVEGPGAPLLRALVELLHRQPELNTAAVVEHFRESEHGLHVARLAVWQHPALAADVTAEFRGVLIQMKRAAIKKKVENLLQKQRIFGLTREEIEELARLTRLARDAPETALT